MLSSFMGIQCVDVKVSTESTYLKYNLTVGSFLPRFFFFFNMIHLILLLACFTIPTKIMKCEDHEDSLTTWKASFEAEQGEFNMQCWDFLVTILQRANSIFGENFIEKTSKCVLTVKIKDLELSSTFMCNKENSSRNPKVRPPPPPSSPSLTFYLMFAFGQLFRLLL